MVSKIDGFDMPKDEARRRVQDRLSSLSYSAKRVVSYSLGIPLGQLRTPEERFIPLLYNHFYEVQDGIRK